MYYQSSSTELKFPEELEKRLIDSVEKLTLVSRKVSLQLLLGNYRSKFRGTGVTFSQVREYTFGDDYRWIDWNVTARMNKPFVKEFEEERERVVGVVGMWNRYMLFASGPAELKWVVALRIYSSLVASAIMAGDRTASIVESANGVSVVPLQKEKRKLPVLIRNGLRIPAREGEERRAIERCERLLGINSLVFFVSDIWGFPADESLLRRVVKKFDAVFVVVMDAMEAPGEVDVPHLTMNIFDGVDVTHLLWNRSLLKGLRDRVNNRLNLLKRICLTYGGRIAVVRTDVSIYTQLNAFLQSKAIIWSPF